MRALRNQSWLLILAIGLFSFSTVMVAGCKKEQTPAEQAASAAEEAVDAAADKAAEAEKAAKDAAGSMPSH